MPFSAANNLPVADFSSRVNALAEVKSQVGGLADPAAATAPAAVQAPRLVQEIRAIADRISSIDRNTVEVSFDFSESDRLSVRVEYRDGAVHTTFRTDSAQLREAIAHQWQAQTANADQRTYQLAEPIFTGNSGLSGGDSGSDRSSSFEQQAGRNPAGFSQNGRGSSSANSSSSAPANQPRTDSSRLFHRFA